MPVSTMLLFAGLLILALFTLNLVIIPNTNLTSFTFQNVNHNIQSLTSAVLNSRPLETEIAYKNAYNALQKNKALTSIASIILQLNLLSTLALTSKSIAETLSALFGKYSDPLASKRVFFILRGFLGNPKEEKPWGVVYDAQTKKPIDPALVTIATDENGVGEFKTTRITDIEGRFSFLVTPGRYLISAEKTNYTFPSEIVQGEKDGNFDNVYHGEVIEVENPYIINLNIPMDPQKYDWNQAQKEMGKNSFIEFFKANGRSLLISAGITSSLLLYYVFPLGIYLITAAAFTLNTLFVKTYIRKKKPWGVVYNRLDQKPIPRITVKAVKMPYKLTVSTTSTDHLGRYFILLAPGTYTIQVIAKDKKGGEKIISQLENIKVTSKKEVINFDILV